MTFATLIALFVLSHLLGDYLFQTQFEAFTKAEGKFWNPGLWSHCTKYTLCFLPVLVAAHRSLFWLGVIMATHLLFDRRWPIVAWRRYVNRNSEEVIKNTFWLTIMTDQIFHLLVLFGIAYAA